MCLRLDNLADSRVHLERLAGQALVRRPRLVLSEESLELVPELVDVAPHAELGLLCSRAGDVLGELDLLLLERVLGRVGYVLDGWGGVLGDRGHLLGVGRGDPLGQQAGSNLLDEEGAVAGRGEEERIVPGDSRARDRAVYAVVDGPNPVRLTPRGSHAHGAILERLHAELSADAGAGDRESRLPRLGPPHRILGAKLALPDLTSSLAAERQLEVTAGERHVPDVLHRVHRDPLGLVEFLLELLSLERHHPLLLDDRSLLRRIRGVALVAHGRVL